jgi:hypothetical protein
MHSKDYTWIIMVEVTTRTLRLFVVSGLQDGPSYPIRMEIKAFQENFTSVIKKKNTHANCIFFSLPAHTNIQKELTLVVFCNETKMVCFVSTISYLQTK